VPFLQKINPDFLIQYGICYPLNKKCLFFVVDKNSCMAKAEVKSQAIEAVLHFEYYLDLETELKIKITKWLGGNRTSYKDHGFTKVEKRVR